MIVFEPVGQENYPFMWLLIILNHIVEELCWQLIHT